jgi:hypothetical protein
VKDKKMSFIRYFERAQPGKKRKIENQKTEKSKEYEARRKERSFNQQWLVGRPWLSFNPTENTMTCIVCSDHYTKIFLTYFSVWQVLVRSGKFFACLNVRQGFSTFGKTVNGKSHDHIRIHTLRYINIHKNVL